MDNPFKEGKKQFSINPEKFQKELLVFLCDELFNPTVWFDEFTAFSESTERIMYSEVTDYIFSINQEKIDLLYSNLMLLDKSFSAIKTVENNENDKLIGHFIRMKDHCLLAIEQRKMIVSKIIEVDKHIESSNKMVLREIIGIISLFTALSFVTFGGISILGSIFESVKTLHFGYTIFVAVLWLFCIGNIFLIFMAFIGHIVDINSLKQKISKYVLVLNITLILVSVLLFIVFLLSQNLIVIKPFAT